MSEPLMPDKIALHALLAQRYSCRAFKPNPVPRATIDAILQLSQRSASWCNSQPWQVIVNSAEATARLRAAMSALPDAPEGYDIDPPAEYRGVYRERRRVCGFGLYESVGIARGDRQASARQAARNFVFFDAPHVAIITTDGALGTYGVLDCGAYIQNFMLVARSFGVATIAQAALASRSGFLREWFDIGSDRRIVCGVSFGYEDPADPANRFRTGRAGLEETVRWVD